MFFLHDGVYNSGVLRRGDFATRPHQVLLLNLVVWAGFRPSNSPCAPTTENSTNVANNGRLRDTGQITPRKIATGGFCDN